MEMLFILVALLGAVMAFGVILLRLVLEGIALIEFVSVADLIVYGVMLLFALANVGWWIYTTRRSKRGCIATARCVSLLSIIGIVLAYTVLLTSLWADAWLKSYVAWCTQYKNILFWICITGLLLLMAALGWYLHKCYIGKMSKEATPAQSPDAPDAEEGAVPLRKKTDWMSALEDDDETDGGTDDGITDFVEFPFSQSAKHPANVEDGDGDANANPAEEEGSSN